MTAFHIGDVVLGKYEITAVLGRGGMGVVYAARHRELDATVALKFLLPSLDESPGSVERFAAEARTAMRLRNEHVVRVHDVGAVDGAPFIVMEFLTGQDLAKVLATRGPLPVAEAVDLLLQACEAVADAHNLGIVHRDLKPANVFVTTGSDELPFVKVLDFGISKSAAHPSVTATAAVVGSPLYMSPEQLAASPHVDPRADVWALGVILYETLTGATPFARESVALVSAAILDGAHPRLSTRRPGVPAALDEAVEAALQVDPEARLSSVEALAARVAPFGTDAARASYERIRRIAARRPASSANPPPTPPGLAETAPPHGTGPAPVAAPSEGRRPRGRWPRAVVAAIVGLPALALVGWRAASWSQASRPAPEGSASTASGPAGLADAAAEGGADAGGGDAPWYATRVEMEGLYLGDFVPASAPSPGHPNGALAVLGSERVLDGWQIAAVSVDVESGRAFARVPLGLVSGSGGAFVSAASGGALFAVQHRKTLDLVTFDAEHGVQVGPTLSLKGLGTDARYELRGLAAFDDRIVLASGGDRTTTLRILDAHGALLTSHDCHAALFRPGVAGLAAVGDQVLVTNLLAQDRRLPICAGQLHGAPRWRELTLPFGYLSSGDGAVYYQGYEGMVLSKTRRALDSTLQPTVPVPEAATDDRCSGLPGGTAIRSETIGHRIFVAMSSCCGGEEGGLFVCKPRSEGGP